MRSNHSTYVQEGGSTGGELSVQSRLRVAADGSSHERPEVLGVLVLPVAPHLVNHLEETQDVSLSTSVNSNDDLTVWCIMKRGSRWRKQISYDHKGVTGDRKAYHSKSILVQGHRRVGRDLEGKNRSYHCDPRSATMNQSNRFQRTLTLRESHG
jgi:hypothetical protein